MKPEKRTITGESGTLVPDASLKSVTGGSDVVPTASRDSVVDHAASRIGCPYVWGAAGPDAFDSAGLVVWCYAKIGISLPHYTEAIFAQAKERLPASEARPGDILYRSGHVAISTGGAACIQAPHTGAAVCRESGNWTCALRV